MQQERESEGVWTVRAATTVSATPTYILLYNPLSLLFLQRVGQQVLDGLQPGHALNAPPSGERSWLDDPNVVHPIH